MCARNKGVLVWNSETNRLEREFEGWDASELGRSLAVLDSGSLAVLDLATGEKRWSAMSGGHSGEPIRFSPDGALIAQARRHPSIRLWNAVDGRLVGLIAGHAYDHHSYKSITALAFSPDGKTLVSGGEDGLIKCVTIADVLRNDWSND